MSRPQVGEVLYLLPHHSFPTANNFDFALLEQNSKIMSIEEVSARGREAPLLGRANGTTSPVRAFHHHQPETESAVDLRTGVLPVRRRRKLHQRVTRSGDRPYQLQAFLGKPVPGSAHSTASVLMQELRLRAAGTACVRAQVCTGCANGRSSLELGYESQYDVSSCTCRCRFPFSPLSLTSP